MLENRVNLKRQDIIKRIFETLKYTAWNQPGKKR